ncbi:hypothetical protein AVEN_214177-1, partial [Araneus ventricosus]
MHLFSEKRRRKYLSAAEALALFYELPSDDDFETSVLNENGEDTILCNINVDIDTEFKREIHHGDASGTAKE